jgi:hypothetical protein
VESDDSQQTDPVAELLGTDGELDAELMQLEGADYMDATSDDPADLVPPGFTLFLPNPDAVQKVRAAGKDPRMVAVRIYTIRQDGKRGPGCGKFSPEGMTLAALRGRLPPGQYDLQGLNVDGKYLGGKRVRLDQYERLAPVERLNGNGNGGGQSAGDKILMALAMRALDGDRTKPSEMEAATAAMLKGVGAMMQMQMADLKRAQMISEREDRQTERGQTQSLEMFKLVMPLLAKQNAAPKNGASSSGMGRFEDFFGALQLGMQLAGNAAGAPPRDEDESSLRSWLLPLADSLGPGLISVIAMMLPPDKARMVSELLEAHFKAREAEANAAAGPESDDPPTVETEGQTVGETT